MDKVMEQQGEELSLEAMFQRLEETVGTMEREKISLWKILSHSTMTEWRCCADAARRLRV